MDDWYLWTKIEKLKNADNLWEKTCDFPIQVTITYLDDFLEIPYGHVTLTEGERSDATGQKKLVVKYCELHAPRFQEDKALFEKWMREGTRSDGLRIVLRSEWWRNSKSYRGFFADSYWNNSGALPGLSNATIELIKPHLVELPPDQISSRQTTQD